MSERELNERIASWFEPKPALTEFQVSNVVVDEVVEIGATGVWRLIFPYGDGDIPTIVTVDYLNDEAANARLLEAMPSPNMYRMPERSGSRDWRLISDQTAPSAWLQHADRKTAIALAFCKWAGIPVEEEL